MQACTQMNRQKNKQRDKQQYRQNLCLIFHIHAEI